MRSPHKRWLRPLTVILLRPWYRQTVNNKIKVTLWDVAGEIDQKKVPNTYWLETSGVIYVIDLTRPSTLENLVEDIEYIKKTVPNALVKVVANKKDVACAEQIETANKTYPIDIITSAKTGENVEKLFEIIAKDIT